MAPIKRTAGSDFEEHNNAKKTCALSTFDRMPIRIITTHVKAAREACLSPRSHHMVTRAVSTRHSTAAVLQTYELLEAILNELPMQKILEARRVSKSWHTVIKRSKPLRAKLFLEAEPRKCLWSLDRATLKLRPYEWGSRERLGEEWMQTQYLSRPSIANPLLFSHDAMLRSPVEIRALTCEGLNFTASPDLSKQRSIVHEMFVTQPPVSVVQFRFYYHATQEPSRPFGRADDFRTVRVVKKEGVKVGHMLAAFKLELQKSQDYQFNSELSISIKAHSSSPARKSVIWMLGAVFVSDEERSRVEKYRKQTVGKTSAEEPAWVGKVLRLES